MNGETPLNRRAEGLLEFFGIKSGTWGPRTLGQQLLPSLELWRHYAASTSEQITMAATVAGAATGAVTPVTPTVFVNIASAVVPAGELWYIDHGSLSGVVSAAVGSRLTQLGLGVFNPGLAGGTTLHLPTRPIGADLPSDATSGAVAQTSLAYPVWVQPGLEFRLTWGGNVAAANNLVLAFSARLNRLRI